MTNNCFFNRYGTKEKTEFFVLYVSLFKFQGATPLPPAGGLGAFRHYTDRFKPVKWLNGGKIGKFIAYKKLSKIYFGQLVIDEIITFYRPLP